MACTVATPTPLRRRLNPCFIFNIQRRPLYYLPSTKTGSFGRLHRQLHPFRHSHDIFHNTFPRTGTLHFVVNRGFIILNQENAEY
jgi:hypothetical protein